MSAASIAQEDRLLAEGDRIPLICGAFADGAFFSTENFIGRTLVLVMGDPLGAAAQHAWAQAMAGSRETLSGLDAEAVLLVSMTGAAMGAHLDPPTPGVVIAQPSSDLAALAGSGPGPRLLILNRAGRIVRIVEITDPEAAMGEACAASAALQHPPGRIRDSVAPLLVVPNLIERRLCRALMAAFEAGAHREGGMASIDAEGHAVLKIEQAKKRRRDLELTSENPLHSEVVDVLSSRLVPEIARSFNVQVAHADRILLARYDDSGGYFHRHRDNAAPHVAFRQFAVSLNLNTDEYEGGELEFPEFDNDFYRPPVGAAAVFSASLMHAARPVTSGRRYVLLTFLHDESAEIMRLRLLPGGN